MEGVRLWLPWPGKGWPASVSEERAFIDRMRSLGGSTGRGARRRRVADRSDVTVLITALRCGASWDDVTGICPGADPVAMAQAYDMLSAAVQEGSLAWTELLADPSVQRVRRSVDSITRVLPGPASMLATLALSEGPNLPEQTAAVAKRINELRRHVNAIEKALADLPSRSNEGIKMGERLYHPIRECHFGHPYFLPLRVAELHHRHVAQILGERELPPAVADLLAADEQEASRA